MNEQSDLQIRRLSVEDVEPFKSIRLEALRSEPANFASSAEDWEKKSDADWRRMIETSPVFVAFQGCDPVGIMGLMRERSSKMAHRASIIMVYTTPAARGRGVAKLLLAALCTYARGVGIEQLELSVSSENPVAIAFYKAQGFQQIGIVPGGFRHEGRDIDDILMARRI